MYEIWVMQKQPVLKIEKCLIYIFSAGILLFCVKLNLHTGPEIIYFQNRTGLHVLLQRLSLK